jgi:prolyl-tRNA synthetase
MKLQNLLGERFKEKPSDATIISQIYLIRGGYIKYVANGIYSLLLPAKRIIAKIEKIVREEMDAIGGQEVLMPVVLPKELWEESGRYQSVGSELLRIKDRGGKDMLLAMTHEEAAVALVRDDATSYSKYPFMIYQLQTKFRDEPRCKGGLIRVREFTMKDAYSFHTNEKDLREYYEICKQAYFRIFKRIGLTTAVAVGSDTGMMGGNAAHEFMLFSDAGEDNIAVCDCGYMDNVEVARTEIINSGNETELKTIHTPGIKDIESLSRFTGLKPQHMIKACVFAVEGDKKPCVVFIRGDFEVNETKLKKALKKNIFALENYEGAIEMGYIGPVGFDSENATVLFDESLIGCKNMLCGANKKDYHYSGVSIGRDFTPPEFHDLYKVRNGDKCLKCGKALTIKKGIEIGNIFQLGKKYTESMNMTYLDEKGERKTPVMGCYGIGIGRSLASVIEERHDNYGPIWPFAIAPWHIHICMLGGNEEMRKFADALYEKLSSEKFEVIYDDRPVSAGVMFSDADLLGVPYRVIFGSKNFTNGNAEIISRDKSFRKIVKIENLHEEIKNIIKEEKAKL